MNGTSRLVSYFGRDIQQTIEMNDCKKAHLLLGLLLTQIYIKYRIDQLKRECCGKQNLQETLEQGNSATLDILIPGNTI